MKFVRSLVLLAMLGAVPGLLVQATGQQEIDPEHFDQAEPAKTAKPALKPKAGPRTAAVKDRQKSSGGAADASRATAGSRQAKTENQRIAAVHSTGE
jgi:hypothetical protein